MVPPAPAPAECTATAFEAFAPQLAGLPPGFGSLNKDSRARVLLSLKESDAEAYINLRAQALRCATH